MLFDNIAHHLAQVGRKQSITAAIGVAIWLLYGVIHARRVELGLSLVLAILVLLIASVLLFVAEGTAQPEAFGSIPRAMWWAMATLTTVGYGDVYPTTTLGKALAGLTAFTSIAIVACLRASWPLPFRMRSTT